MQLCELPHQRIHAAKLDEFAWHRQKNRPHRLLDRVAVADVPNRYAQTWTLNITGETAGVSYGTEVYPGRPDQPCTIIPINHVITRSPEDREGRREIDRPLERDLELTWQHRFNPSLVLAQAPASHGALASGWLILSPRCWQSRVRAIAVMPAPASWSRDPEASGEPHTTRFAVANKSVPWRRQIRLLVG